MSIETVSYGDRYIPRRPRESDEFVLSDVFDAILSDLAGECDWNLEKDAGYINDNRADFLEAARSGSDGYEIMRNLERYSSWDGNTRLVEIFDDAPFRKCLCAHVQKWIDAFNIKPLRQVGDVVTFRYGCEELRGVIEATESLFEPGVYEVSVAGMDGRPLVRWEEL